MQLSGRLDPTYSIGQVEAPLSVCEPRGQRQAQLIEATKPVDAARLIREHATRLFCTFYLMYDELDFSKIHMRARLMVWEEAVCDIVLRLARRPGMSMCGAGGTRSCRDKG